MHRYVQEQDWLHPEYENNHTYYSPGSFKCPVTQNTMESLLAKIVD